MEPFRHPGSAVDANVTSVALLDIRHVNEQGAVNSLIISWHHGVLERRTFISKDGDPHHPSRHGQRLRSLFRASMLSSRSPMTCDILVASCLSLLDWHCFWEQYLSN